MARGWESKSVEEARQEAEERRAERQKPAQPKSPEELQLEVELESLEMTRRRLLTDIAATENERYREQLRAGLQHVEDKLRALGWQAPVEHSGNLSGPDGS